MSSNSTEASHDGFSVRHTITDRQKLQLRIQKHSISNHAIAVAVQLHMFKHTPRLVSFWRHITLTITTNHNGVRYSIACDRAYWASVRTDCVALVAPASHAHTQNV